MKRRAALQASLTALATVLAPSLALATALRVPEEDHVVVDWDGEVTFVGEWEHTYVYEDVRAEVEMLLIDPDYRIFSNFPIVCRDPELQARVTVLLGATEAEVEEERDRWDKANYIPLAEREGFSLKDDPEALQRLV